MTIDFRHKYSLFGQNSLGVPSVCDTYIEINDQSQIVPIVEHASHNKLSIFILGEGTNLVLKQNIRGLVVKPNILGKQHIEENDKTVTLRVGAGENWHELVTWALEQGYFGLENLALIPGSCGAAPVQNIGAYGVEVCAVIERVDYVDLVTRTPEVLSKRDCQFGYRDSIFKHDLANRALITSIDLCLQKVASVNHSYPALSGYLQQHGLEVTPQSIYQAVCEVRRSKLPDVTEIPNAGSFFKNPIVSKAEYDQLVEQHPDLPGYPRPEDDDEIKVPAAWLIEFLGWKGRFRNGVGMHEKQALVLTNPGHRTGEHVLGFAEKIRDSVKQQFGIVLEIEPRIVGN